MLFGCIEAQATLYSTTKDGIKYITDGYFKEAYATCNNGITTPKIEIMNSVSFYTNKGKLYSPSVNRVSTFQSKVLENVTIPTSVTNIDVDAFQACPNLKSITMPSSFSGSFSFIEKLPKGVTVYVGHSDFGIVKINYGEYATIVDLEQRFLKNVKSYIHKITFEANSQRFEEEGFEFLGFYDEFLREEIPCKDAVYTINSKANTTNKIYAKVVKDKDTTYISQDKLITLSTGVKYDFKSTQTTATFSNLTANSDVSTGDIDHIYVSAAPISGHQSSKSGSCKNNGTVHLSNLIPYPFQGYTTTISVTYKDGISESHRLDFSGLTKRLGVKLSAVAKGSTAAIINASVDPGDAEIRTEKIFVGDSVYKSGHFIVTGLEPGNTYTIKYHLYVKGQPTYIYDGYKEYLEETTDIVLPKINFISQQPKVISVGNVIVAAESNIAENEKNIGFEWRRTDWTNDFDSNKGQAYIYDGKMEGYIHNMNAEKLWKYRPYYYSNSGNYYYGDWIGIDPSNTSYFEPTVHTYDNITVNNNVATVNGYSLRGTDVIKKQGFQYWKVTNSSNVSSNRVLNIPSNATTIEAGGVMMTAVLSNLDYNSTYSVRSFVSTDEGTFYGETRTFSTGSNTTGIENVVSIPNKVNNTTKGIYDISGRKLPALQHGINIVIGEDGTRRKIYIK